MRRSIGNPLTRMNVKQQLILLFVLLACPVFALHGYGNEKAEHILKRHVTEAYAELNKVNHRLIGRDLETVNQVTKTIIQHSLTQEMKPNEAESDYQRIRRYEAMEDYLKSLSLGAGGESISYSLYVYDPDGRYGFAPKHSTGAGGVYFYGDEDSPEWVEEAIEQKGSGYLRVVERRRSTGGKTLAYMRAVKSIWRNNVVIGVLVVSNLDEKIGDSLRSVSLPGGSITLTDAAGRVLATTADAPLGEALPLPEEANRLLAAGGGAADLIADGMIYVLHANDAGTERLVYSIPEETLLRQQSELTRIIQLITLAYSAFAFLVMVYLWRSLIAPLQKLASFIRQYEPGDVVPSTPGGDRRDEVGLLMRSVYDSARRLNDLVHYKYFMEIKQKEAQLQLLYQQINPHLLYNTLESIYWKSTLEGNVASAEMIKELSSLMKIALSRGRELISLREELEHATAYAGLQQKRYEYEFQVEWRVAEDILDSAIPKITLQPLIENAILHGVKHMGEDGRIAVAGDAKDGIVTLRVEDNGYKPVDFAAIDRLLYGESPDPSIGYGIRNVHERIQLHYGKAYGLRYTPREGGGTVATLTLPRREAGTQEAKPDDV